jgi:xanthine dehydrogenase accessory factor
MSDRSGDVDPSGRPAPAMLGMDDDGLATLLPELTAQLRSGPLAVARIVAVNGSSPRRPGATMAVNVEGAVFGSVTGGCVEGTVYELCREVLQYGEAITEHFSQDSGPFAPQLTCGGAVTVRVEKWGPEHIPALTVLHGYVTAGPEEPTATSGDAGLVTDGLVTDGALGPHDRQALALRTGHGLPEAGAPSVLLARAQARDSEPYEQNVHLVWRRPEMVLVGSTEFVGATARAGRALGYRTTVVDARQVFTTRERFPDADEVVCEWPARWLHRHADRFDERSVVLVLTHDPKIDIPVLEEVLGWDGIGYIGAMGSSAADARRRAELAKHGVDLAELHSPVGLAIGNRGPEETAVSIVAGVIAAKRAHGAST